MRQIVNRVFFIIFISLSMGLASCHKDTGNTGPRLVQTMTIDGNSCQINCTYDAQNRVTLVTQCDTSETYTYYKDSVVYTRSDNSGFEYKHIYTLDPRGIATGYRHIAKDGSVTVYTINYNGSGQRISTIDVTHPNTGINYTVQNGNEVYDSSASSVTGAGNYTIARTFYASTINTIANVNFGRTFLGNSSVNFKKSEAFNTPDGQSTVQYTYVLDYLNGVSTRTITENGSIVETRLYTYY